MMVKLSPGQSSGFQSITGVRGADPSSDGRIDDLHPARIVGVKHAQAHLTGGASSDRVAVLLLRTVSDALQLTMN